MSDEAHFHLSVYTNKQNGRYWSLENAEELHQHLLHSPKVTKTKTLSARSTTMLPPSGAKKTDFFFFLRS